jgi:heptosyltransferase III
MAEPAILFVTAGSIGDAVLSTGLLAHLIETNPEARFTVVAGPAPAPLFRGVPRLERAIALTKRGYSRHWLDLYREVAGRRWELAVDLRGSALVYLLRARRRAMMAKGDPREHRVVQLARLFALSPPPAPRLWARAEDRDAAARLLGQGPILALGPAANWAGKQWPAERYAELAKRLTAPGAILAQARIAVFAAAHERERIAALLDALPPERLIDVTAGRDLGIVAAALGKARLFIGNDSGLMHIAAAMRVPTLGLFGPTSDVVYGPWGEATAVVRTDEPMTELLAAAKSGARPIHLLMDSLPVERVERAAIALFERSA